jgi:hypothetical protein
MADRACADALSRIDTWPTVRVRMRCRALIHGVSVASKSRRAYSEMPLHEGEKTRTRLFTRERRLGHASSRLLQSYKGFKVRQTPAPSYDARAGSRPPPEFVARAGGLAVGCGGAEGVRQHLVLGYRSGRPADGGRDT